MARDDGVVVGIYNLYRSRFVVCVAEQCEAFYLAKVRCCPIQTDVGLETHDSALVGYVYRRLPLTRGVAS